MLNVKDFGAKGDGKTDDRPAIQSAINVAVSADQAGIFVPAGTYRLSPVPREEVPGARWSLDLRGVQDLTIAGEGPRSVLRLSDTTERTGDWHVFILRDGCRRVVFSDLVIDGNQSGLADPDEQSHGVEVEAATEDLVVERCILRDCFGDGIRILAAGEDHARGLRIVNCLFQHNNRSGLSVQRGAEKLIVANCIFDSTISDQSIEVEPTDVESDSPTDVIIQGCLVNHTNRTNAVTLSGIEGTNPLARVRFANNVVLGGPVFCTDVDQLAIQDNIVQLPEAPVNRIPVEVGRGGDSVLISGNLLVSEGANNEAVISVSEANGRQVTRAIVANNMCFARAHRGIQCLSSDEIAIMGNLVVATGACSVGIHVRAESSNVDHVSIRGNDVTVEQGGGWQEAGINVAGSQREDPPEVREIHHISIVDNSVRGADVGLRFQGPVRRTPLCALNRLDAAVPSPVAGLPSLPEGAVVVGGIASLGGTDSDSGAGRTLAGIGDPNGRVVGNVGDVFHNLSGGAGSTLYVKESGNGTNTGWSGK